MDHTNFGTYASWTPKASSEVFETVFNELRGKNYSHATFFNHKKSLFIGFFIFLIKPVTGPKGTGSGELSWTDFEKSQKCPKMIESNRTLIQSVPYIPNNRFHAIFGL